MQKKNQMPGPPLFHNVGCGMMIVFYIRPFPVTTCQQSEGGNKKSRIEHNELEDGSERRSTVLETPTFLVEYNMRLFRFIFHAALRP
jgi:hypothetical protein